MAGTPPHPDTGDDTGVAPDRESTNGTPRWVKVFGVVALVLVLLFVVLFLTGRGGGHGPGRHSSGGGGGATPPSRATEGHTPPAGGRAPPSSVTEHGVRQP